MKSVALLSKSFHIKDDSMKAFEIVSAFEPPMHSGSVGAVKHFL